MAEGKLRRVRGGVIAWGLAAASWLVVALAGGPWWSWMIFGVSALLGAVGAFALIGLARGWGDDG